MEVAVIVAMIAFFGQIILAIIQNRNLRNQANKTDMETTGILIEKALNISKQENETLRMLNETLRRELDCCKAENEKIEKEKDKMEEQLELCRDTVRLLEEEIERKTKSGF